MSSIYTLILAAGKGTRMKSDIPKVLHPLLGRPMIEYIIRSAHELNCKQIFLIIGYKAELAREQLEAMGQELEEHPDPDTPEQRDCLAAAVLRGHEHLSTGHPLRVGKLAVFVADEIAAQRDHTQNPDEPSGHGQERELEEGRLHPPQEQGGNREEYPRGHRGAGGAHGLRHVGFQDGVPRAEEGKGPKENDGQDGHGDRG